MFGGSSHNSAFLNAMMISSNFSQLFSTTPLQTTPSTIVASATTTTQLLMTSPPSYAEACLNANHQRQFAKKVSNCSTTTANLAAIASPDILRLAAETTAVSLNDKEDEQRQNNHCLGDEVSMR